MHPIPCAHCGNNFMRRNLDPNAPRLCNSCEIREEKRNPTKEDKMSTIDVVITMPREDHIALEEQCINQGINFSKYFLNLYYAYRSVEETLKEIEDSEDQEEKELTSNFKTNISEKNYKPKTKAAKK